MKIKKTLLIILIIFISSAFSVSYSQTSNTLRHYNNEKSLRLKNIKTETYRKGATVLPISIGVLAAVYIINPVLELSERKLYLGLTKEFSIGWGKLGEHRTSAEYTIIFSGNVRHKLRFSYKYDFLLKPGIQPSHMFQGTSVISAGAGYYTDFQSFGFFPELTYGYSIRNHKLLFFPHIKIRHTFMKDKEKPDITDLSFGIILGIANPFIDLDIRRKY